MKKRVLSHSNLKFSSLLFSTGLALISNLQVISPISNIGLELEVTEEPQLHLQSKVELSGGPALCMQLSQPNTIFNQQITKTMEIPSSSKIFKNTLKLKYKIRGKSHGFNRKNNEMCNKILSR